jgi:hypothetical protein
MAASVLAKKLGETFNIQRGISPKAEVMHRTSAVKLLGEEKWNMKYECEI